MLDVFMMPTLFFVSGYFAFSSLDKKGVWSYLKDKAKRLLIPWVLAVLIIQPLLFYDQPTQLVRPFWMYWLSYMGSFPIRLAFLPQTVTQGPYWFISLLFAFFVVFALAHAVIRRWSNGMAPTEMRKASSGNSRLLTLVLFGVLTAIGYFAVLLFIPDTGWLTLGAFLEFQPTRLILFAGYFALGVYAQSHNWLGGGRLSGRIAPWAAVSAVLMIAYLVMSQPLYDGLAGATSLSVSFLLPFAFVRSFLVLSLLVVLVSVGERYWNQSSRLDTLLSNTSYNIYLSHVWFVVIVQVALLGWGGPVLAKFAIVLLATLGISFAISRWAIGRHPRATAAVIWVCSSSALLSAPEWVHKVDFHGDAAGSGHPRTNPSILVGQN